MEIVRFYQPEVEEHRETIAQLLKICMTESFTCPVAEEFYTQKIDGLEQYLQEGKAYFYAAKDETEVVGFLWACVLDTLWNPKFHVLYFAVIPKYRGCGVGASLLRRCEEQAKLLGISAMELIVSGNNTNAVYFYDHQSYQTDRLILTKKLTDNRGEEMHGAAANT